jgi:bifunctional ADP-heptose synthase (sugar kinase/adenylyltransferase)
MGERLRAATGVRGLLVTRGARGLTLFEADGVTHIPAIPVEVFDGTGAGDSTIAAATLGLAAGGTLAEAVAIGNAAGSAVVRKAGVATAKTEELSAILLPQG